MPFERYPLVMDNVRLGYHVRRCKIKEPAVDGETLISRETVVFPFEAERNNDIWPCVKIGNQFEITIRDTDIEGSILVVKEMYGAKAEQNLRNTDGFFYICPVVIFDNTTLDLSIERGIKNEELEGSLGDTFLPGSFQWLPSFCQTGKFSTIVDPHKGHTNMIYEAIGRSIIRKLKQPK